MSDLIWINGQIVPMAEARIGVEDRGFQFADGVYEVIRLYGGRPFTLREHLDRLDRSARAIQIAPPLASGALAEEVRRFLARGSMADGMIYLQLTRGACPRNHLFPDPSTCRPTLLFYVRPLPPPPQVGEGEGIRLLSVPDERWNKCWIKSIALLANVLAKNAAVAAGADEALFVGDGDVISECSASNLFAVIGGKLVTHPVGPKVLPGITRAVILELAATEGIGVEERPLRRSEARSAAELFITSTTREIAWVSTLDGTTVGNGAPGAVCQRLHRRLKERIALE